MKALPISEVYPLIEQGPVVLLATCHLGRANVMTMSWHMMVDFDPPLIACVVSSANHSYEALLATGECVIAIPDVRLAPVVVAIGNVSGRDVDKFAKLGLRTLPAECVAAPLLADCFANLECRVVDTTLTRELNLFVLRVTRAWTDPRQKSPKMLHHAGYGKFVVDGETIKLKSRKP